jgi:hypothetical protein
MTMTEPSGRKAQGNHLCLGRKPAVGANFLWLAVIPWALYLGLVTVPAMAAEQDGLRAFLAKAPAAEIFPGADRYGKPQGSPPAAAVFRGNEQIGYVFLNTDFFPSIGYSGKPIHVLLAIDMAGVIRGARLVKHSEPIVLIGIPERKITAIIDGYVGFNVPALLAGPSDHKVDIVSGATVTIMVIDDSRPVQSVKSPRIWGRPSIGPGSWATDRYGGSSSPWATSIALSPRPAIPRPQRGRNRATPAKPSSTSMPRWSPSRRSAAACWAMTNTPICGNAFSPDRVRSS